MSKNPIYERYFRNFVAAYERKDDRVRNEIDYREKARKEDFMPLSSMDYKSYEDDEDEKYN